MAKRLKSISRIDQPEKHTHGWYVRVHFKGKEVSKFFPDKLHKGKNKALANALVFRNETEEKLGKPRTDRPVIMRRPKKRGVVGVRETVYRTRNAEGEARESPVFEVTWNPEPNVVRRTSVSIRKYGKKEAFRRAVELRKEKEAEYYGSVEEAAPAKRARR
jgi:hypothetical protein